MTLSDLATADLLVERESINLWLVRAMTRTGATWLQNNVVADPWQWFGNSLAVDHRSVAPLVEGAELAGLKVAA